MNSVTFYTETVFPFLLIAGTMFGIALHCLFAYAVYLDAKQLDEETGKLRFVAAGAWGGTVVIFGLFGVLVYWLIHHSALRSYDSVPSSQATFPERKKPEAEFFPNHRK